MHAPSLNELIGCTLQSIEMFEVSLKLKMSGPTGSFSLTTLGDVSLVGEETPNSYVSDTGIAALRDAVGDLVTSIDRYAEGIRVVFGNGAPVKITAAPENDYAISLRTEGGNEPSVEVFE